MKNLKHRFFSLSIAVVAIVFSFSCKQNSTVKTSETFTYKNPITSGIDTNGLRDCHVLRDGDCWYMTGTAYPHWSRQETEGNYNKGVPLYKSKDLLNWEFVKYIVKAGGVDKWYHRRFWAPEIQKVNGKYYALFNCRNDELGFVGQHPG